MPVKKKAKKKPAAKKRTAARKRTTTRKAAPKRKTTTRKAAARKKTTRKAAPKKKAAARKPAKKKVARKPNPAFMKPMQPDTHLSAVVGSRPIPRTEITKKLWAYIKRNKLQNPANKREIVADDKLQPVFGGKKKVNMFEMTKLVSKHMK